MCCDQNIMMILGAVILAVFIGYLMFGKTLENYRDPIYLNRRKMLCDWYPRANGSIYGLQSHVLSGFPYWDSAY
jgi:hypothetical protein